MAAPLSPNDDRDRDRDRDAAYITALLDAIPGAFERTQEGIAQARRDEGIPSDLLDSRRPDQG